MKKSVGIIPYKIVDGKYYFFVGHPGGWTREWWSFLKGGSEGDEDEIETALREFKEESGVDLSAKREDLIYLGIVQQNKTKKVAAFGIHYPDIDPSKCFSNLIEDGVTPEIDRYCWMEWTELEPLTHPAHIPFYKAIMGEAMDIETFAEEYNKRMQWGREVVDMLSSKDRENIDDVLIDDVLYECGLTEDLLEKINPENYDMSNYMIFPTRNRLQYALHILDKDILSRNIFYLELGKTEYEYKKDKIRLLMKTADKKRSEVNSELVKLSLKKDSLDNLANIIDDISSKDYGKVWEKQ